MDCHAKLLAASGQRTAALARLMHLSAHAQTPALQRSDVAQALHRRDVSPEDLQRVQVQAAALDLDTLVQEAAVAG